MLYFATLVDVIAFPQLTIPLLLKTTLCLIMCLKQPQNLFNNNGFSPSQPPCHTILAQCFEFVKHPPHHPFLSKSTILNLIFPLPQHKRLRQQEKVGVPRLTR